MNDKLVIRPIVDEEGENQPLCMFLMMYGSSNHNIEQIREHLKNSGYDGMWPDWVNTEKGHLTKDGAQLWIKHLISLEPQLPITQPGSEEHELIAILTLKLIECKSSVKCDMNNISEQINDANLTSRYRATIQQELHRLQNLYAYVAEMEERVTVIT